MGNTNEPTTSPNKGEELIVALMNRFSHASESVPALPTSIMVHPRCVVAGGCSGEFTATTTLSPSVKVNLGDRCVLDSIAKSNIPGLGLSASAFISTILSPLKNQAVGSASSINWALEGVIDTFVVNNATGETILCVVTPHSISTYTILSQTSNKAGTVGSTGTTSMNTNGDTNTDMNVTTLPNGFLGSPTSISSNGATNTISATSSTTSPTSPSVSIITSSTKSTDPNINTTESPGNNLVTTATASQMYPGVTAEMLKKYVYDMPRSVFDIRSSKYFCTSYSKELGVEKYSLGVQITCAASVWNPFVEQHYLFLGLSSGILLSLDPFSNTLTSALKRIAPPNYTLQSLSVMPMSPKISSNPTITLSASSSIVPTLFYSIPNDIAKKAFSLIKLLSAPESCSESNSENIIASHHFEHSGFVKLSACFSQLFATMVETTSNIVEIWIRQTKQPSQSQSQPSSQSSASLEQLLLQSQHTFDFSMGLLNRVLLKSSSIPSATPQLLVHCVPSTDAEAELDTFDKTNQDYIASFSLKYFTMLRDYSNELALLADTSSAKCASSKGIDATPGLCFSQAFYDIQDNIVALSPLKFSSRTSSEFYSRGIASVLHRVTETPFSRSRSLLTTETITNTMKIHVEQIQPTIIEGKDDEDSDVFAFDDDEDEELVPSTGFPVALPAMYLFHIVHQYLQDQTASADISSPSSPSFSSSVSSSSVFSRIVQMLQTIAAHQTTLTHAFSASSSFSFCGAAFGRLLRLTTTFPIPTIIFFANNEPFIAFGSSYEHVMPAPSTLLFDLSVLNSASGTLSASKLELSTLSANTEALQGGICGPIEVHMFPKGVLAGAASQMLWAKAHSDNLSLSRFMRASGRLVRSSAAILTQNCGHKQVDIKSDDNLSTKSTEESATQASIPNTPIEDIAVATLPPVLSFIHQYEALQRLEQERMEEGQNDFSLDSFIASPTSTNTNTNVSANAPITSASVPISASDLSTSSQKSPKVTTSVFASWGSSSKSSKPCSAQESKNASPTATTTSMTSTPSLLSRVDSAKLDIEMDEEDSEGVHGTCSTLISTYTSMLVPLDDETAMDILPPFRNFCETRSGLSTVPKRNGPSMPGHPLSSASELSSDTDSDDEKDKEGNWCSVQSPDGLGLVTSGAIHRETEREREREAEEKRAEEAAERMIRQARMDALRAKRDAREKEYTANPSRTNEGTGKTKQVMGENRDLAADNLDKVRQAADTSERIRESAQNFGDYARRIKEQSKNSWF